MPSSQSIQNIATENEYICVEGNFAYFSMYVLPWRDNYTDDKMGCGRT